MYFFVKFFISVIVVTLSIALSGCGGSSSPSSVPNTPVPPSAPTPTPTPTPTPVPDVTLDSITLSAVTDTLKVPQTLQISATGSYSDGSTENITDLVSWTSSDSSVLEISENGTINTKAAGIALVTASLDNTSSQQSISVKQLTDISISPNSVTIAENTSAQLSVVGLYSDNSVEDFDNIIVWQSSSNDIAIVNEANQLQGLSEGSTAISASIQNLSTQISVEVTPATLQSINVLSSVNELPAGLSTQFTAVGVYSDGSEQDLSTQVQWSVSDTAKANIEASTGLLSAIEAGVTLVTASKQGIIANAPLLINQATLNELNITPSNITLAEGSSASVSVTGIFSNNTKLDLSAQVQWQIIDQDIANFDTQSLRVEGVSAGGTEILVTAPGLGIEARAQISVSDASLLSIALAELSRNSLPLAQSKTYRATGIYSDGSRQDISDQVTWLSSNENSVIVSNATGSKGFAQTLLPGTSVVSAVLGEVQSSTSLQAVDADLISLHVKLQDPTLPQQTSTKLEVVGTFSDGTRLDMTSQVAISASNNRIVNLQFSNNGRITGVSPGTVVLSASFDGIVGVTELTITDARLERLVINAPHQNVPLGLSMNLSVLGEFSDGSSKTMSEEVTWQVDDTERASISNAADTAGLLTTNASGDIQVRVSLGGFSDSVDVSISDTIVNSIVVSTESAQLGTQSTLSATAVATFDDDSSRDVSNQVIWSSNNIEVAWVSNSKQATGTITGLQEGIFELQAQLNNVASNAIELSVVSDDNALAAIAIEALPNIINNNGADSANINIKLIPSSQSDIIEDGTQITLNITEGNQTRTVQLNSIDGEANYTLQSSYDGFISVSANQGQATANTGLISTPNLSDALSGDGRSRISFEDGVLATDSIFLVLLRNITNREFTLTQIDIGYLDPANANAFVPFPESPVLDNDFISDGLISAGEFHAIGYELTEDIQASEYIISYLFTEALSGQAFRLEARFDFAQ